MTRPSHKRPRPSKKTALFSSRGEAALARWLSQGPVLLAFDLDGTLVPLIRDFNKVKLSSPIRAQLLQLATRHPVTVISGRGLKDLRQIVHAKKLKLVGNHGLEGIEKLKHQLHVPAWHRALAKALHGQKGVQIEDKKISISIHYRNSPRRVEVQKILSRTISALEGPLRVIKGKAVFNIIPDFGHNKGWAIKQLQKKYKCKRALYVGDDITDEDVFKMRDKTIFGIHVGSARKTEATYFIEKQRDIHHLLAYLVQNPS